MIQGIFLTAIFVLAVGVSSNAGEVGTIEDRAISFVETFNSGDGSTFLAFQEQNYASSLLKQQTNDERLESYQRLFREIQTQTINDLELIGDDGVVLTTESPAGEVARFEFRFEQQLISGVSIDIGEFPQFDPDFPRLELRGDLTEENLKKALTEYFEELETKDLFSGAVLIQQSNNTLFEGAYGFASRRYKVPNRLNTRFDVGSITKEFTKVAIAQLLERGKLTLEDKIIKHLPNYPNQSVAEQVSVKQLVNHTSGLGDVFTTEYFESSKLRFREPSDYIELFADDPLLFEPGEGKAYSNFGYVVLGAIIEAVSGQGYADYVRSNVFEVAGMAGSGFFPSDEPVPNVAIGFTKIDADGQAGENIRNNILLMPVNGAPDGGSHSTVYDLAAFDVALRKHRLLSPPYTRWISGGPEPVGDEKTSNGDRVPVTSSIGIAGGAPGLNAVLLSDGERRIIVLANMDEPVAEQVAEILNGELGW